MARPSDRLGVVLLVLAALAAGAAWHAGHGRRAGLPLLAEHAAIVGRLGLTDLCLFTEARYTRHPSQSDHFAPFQDHPAALEHFPSGSLVVVPR